MKNRALALLANNAFMLVFGSIGALILVVALIVAGSVVWRNRTYVAIPASVIEMVPCNGDSLCPRVSYRGPDGVEREITGSVSTNYARYAPEDRVTLRYNPAEPQSAYIDDAFENWFVPGLLGFLGAVFCTIACLTRKL